jgi:O-6-methylguanine DNA methyltransferase
VSQDALESMLRDYFRPEPLAPGWARRMARRLGRAPAEKPAEPGALAVEVTPDGVARLGRGRQGAPATAAARRLVERARMEVAEYLAGRRSFFSVPVDLSAVPDFQRRVLEAAREIPFGEWRPYAWVAERIGHPRAVRAVGTALGRNPVPLLVPCHRVWRSDGGLGGYIFGTAFKERLLVLERRTPVLEGCTTTRIVCRVGCVHGRRMRPEHRVIFASVGDARAVGYRPCRVCRPAA